MKVSQLIEDLQKMPQDATIVVGTRWAPIVGVIENKTSKDIIIKVD